MIQLAKKIEEITEKREPAALCIVTESRGSSPLKAGAKMLVWEDGSTWGTIGGGALEKSVIKNAHKVIGTQNPETTIHNLVKDHQMCCGGTVRVFIEPVYLPRNLYIFGGGHVGKALCHHAAALDFHVTVIDDRKEIFDSWENPLVQYVNQDPVKAIHELPWDRFTYAVILTYDHSLDREILTQCIQKPRAYLGMIGSKRKAAVTMRMLLEKGVTTPEELEKVDTPIGLAINAQSPHELAIGILGKLIREKNKPAENTAWQPKSGDQKTQIIEKAKNQ